MRRNLRIVLWACGLGWLALILWLGAEDGAATALTSGRLAAFVVRMLGLAPGSLAQVDAALRLAAHGVLYFALGGLLWAACRVTWPRAARLTCAVLAACFTVAVLDEVRKVLIPGRHLSWPEAGLNAAGALLGVLCALGLYRLRARRRRARGGAA